ncbi:MULTISPECIES: branched-chain amino acid ABC transporter permease [Bosea]|uniref:branched-chain amino acid ABC transporter permease n=1 Tax=Bosea TaxID=85413 RepID=UPI00214FC983|nr:MULTISPECIES: branched-chain amino acid ABC transporter permease [Bosea]MCR4520384.1 branched-chain amino acid ABC transporter permease [Bosea sp. 47.2.35]MDR6827735.1 branched-chain amino acid transport system permease protein [Bosea robiniae]MDR6894571.1 branched-chain amino acid transport system permease protein [Bosea sp. BE109]MDR7137841.1 branched-chain amino acid transport system permease protein [Bosea sp. BE168]MDR7174540.1 branched-chain amino acid transport system permease protei
MSAPAVQNSAPLRRATGRIDAALIGLILGAVILWFAPVGMGRYGTYVLSLWLVMSIGVMGLNLTLGYAGQTSLAQAAFMGLGAYTTAILTTKYGVNWYVAFALSGLLTFAVGLLLGFPALRVRTHYLAFVTLAFSTLIWLVLRNEQWLTGGVFGISNINRPNFFGIKLFGALEFHRFVVVVTLILSLKLWWLIRSPWGRAFTALRENPVRAASLGTDTRAYTLLAFAIGSAYGGFAGALYAPLVEFIDPSPFSLSQSLFLLLMVVAGGAGYLFGPFVGALLGVVLPEWLRFAGSLYLIIFAAIVLALLVICPQGVSGLIERGWNALRRKTGGTR